MVACDHRTPRKRCLCVLAVTRVERRHCSAFTHSVVPILPESRTVDSLALAQLKELSSPPTTVSSSPSNFGQCALVWATTAAAQRNRYIVNACVSRKCLFVSHTHTHTSSVGVRLLRVLSAAAVSLAADGFGAYMCVNRICVHIAVNITYHNVRVRSDMCVTHIPSTMSTRHDRCRAYRRALCPMRACRVICAVRQRLGSEFAKRLFRRSQQTSTHLR